MSDNITKVIRFRNGSVIIDTGTSKDLRGFDFDRLEIYG